jgi:hypothetical protein
MLVMRALGMSRTLRRQNRLDRFEGVKTLARHRMVYAALTLMQTDIQR